MSALTTPDTSALERISGLTPEFALQSAARCVADLAGRTEFREVEIPCLLVEARGAREWYVARRYDALDGSYSLQVFVWPPETGTEIHDHSCWGAYLCVVGTVTEERYERLDDGLRPDHARLRKVWELNWAPWGGVSTVLPGDWGIHRVSNRGTSIAISVHLYGPRIGEVDGRDYDPSREYVCDRWE